MPCCFLQRTRKSAKEMSECDYPGYGSMEHDGSKGAGERKIAHSAQMYHYQHQKQQILDLEKLVSLLMSFAFCFMYYIFLLHVHQDISVGSVVHLLFTKFES